MSKIYSWDVSDKFWSRVEPLIPVLEIRNTEKSYIRKSGGGRKPLSPRKIFSGIIYVLRTGCQWKALNKDIFGSASSIHKYFRLWLEAGFFESLWVAGLAEYDELAGIAWAWQSIDGSNIKAPLALEAVGPNSTDRGKKWNQKTFAGRRKWNPVINSRNRSSQA